MYDTRAAKMTEIMDKTEAGIVAISISIFKYTFSFKILLMGLTANWKGDGITATNRLISVELQKIRCTSALQNITLNYGQVVNVFNYRQDINVVVVIAGWDEKEK